MFIFYEFRPFFVEITRALSKNTVIILYVYYISIMINSISYRLVDLVWIDRMHNK